MENMVKVKAKDTNEVLFTCSIQELEKAYEYAAQMDEMGIEVDIDAPSISDTLSHSLGLGAEDKAMYQDSLDNEINDHDGSCCAKPFTKN